MRKGEKKVEYTIERIKKSKSLKKKFEKHFKETLEECGEMLLPGTSFDYVLDVMERQGYWSGIAYNICLGDYGLEWEQRRFG